MYTLSVIIPTHKRSDLLQQCLDHLERQTMAGHLEVIVVSDGHDDATAKLMETHTWQMSVQFLEIKKSQQGVARNRGVEAATSPLVLFIGDDILLTPGACETHVKTHEMLTEKDASLSAVLGFTTWDTSLEITPVMRWLERSGWQFGYPFIQKYAHSFLPKSKQHLFTYTSHISLPLPLAKAHPFREDLLLYGWEDILWGIDLRDAHIGLYFEPDAVAYHRHTLDLPASLKRMETIGKSAVIAENANPKLRRIPRGWKKWAYRLIAILPTMRGRHTRAFLRGIGNAQ